MASLQGPEAKKLTLPPPHIWLLEWCAFYKMPCWFWVIQGKEQQQTTEAFRELWRKTHGLSDPTVPTDWLSVTPHTLTLSVSVVFFLQEPKMTRSRLKQAVQQGQVNSHNLFWFFTWRLDHICLAHLSVLLSVWLQVLSWSQSAVNMVKVNLITICYGGWFLSLCVWLFLSICLCLSLPQHPQFVDIDLEEDEDSSDEEYCPDEEEEEDEDTVEEVIVGSSWISVLSLGVTVSHSWLEPNIWIFICQIMFFYFVYFDIWILFFSCVSK